MAVEVRIPGALQAMLGGAKAVKADGETVAEVIANLSERYPGFRERVLTPEGDVLRFVNIYVNDEDIRFLDKLQTNVSDGDIVQVLPALAGGED